MPHTRLDGLKAFLSGFSGLIHIMFMRFQEAEDACTRGIELNPSLAYNYGLRAHTRLYLENFDGAVEDCTKKLSLRPSDAAVYALRGRAHYCVGDYLAVKDDLEKAMELEPERRWYALDSLRLIEAYRELGYHDKVIDLCTTTIKPRLDRYFVVELLERRADAYMKMGQIDKALIDYNRAVALAPKGLLVDLYMQRAEIHEAQKNDELAERDRFSAANLQSHQAQMAEWIPANPQQRTIAKLLDGMVVGAISALVVFVIGIGFDVSVHGGNFAGIELASWLPAITSIFFLGLFDTFFVCLAPALMIISLPALGSHIGTSSVGGAPIEGGALDPVMQMIIAMLVVSLVNWFYHALGESSHRQSTLGKTFFRLRVTDIDGATISFWRATARHFLRVVASFVFIFGLVAFVFMTIGSGYPFRIIAMCFFLFLLVVGVGASLDPGLHNSLAMCIVSDSHLYPGLKLGITHQGPEEKGA